MLFLRLCLVILLSFQYHVLRSQAPFIDSLIHIVTKEPDGLSKIDHYNTISSDLVDLGYFEEAKVHAENALTLSKKLNSLNGSYVAHINLGNIYADQGQTDESITEYNKALDIAEGKADLKMQAECLNNIGLVYYNTAKYEDALQHFNKSLTFRRQIHFEQGIIDSYTNIGNVFTQRGQYPEAMEAFLECLKLSEKNNNQSGILNSYNNISVVLLSQGKNNDALTYLEQAKEIAENLNDQHTLANIYNNIGLCHYFQHDIAKALVNFKASLKMRKSISDYHGLTVSYNNIGAIHEQLNELDSALIYYEEARNTQLVLDDLHAASATLLNMAILETRRGQFDQARTLLDNSLALAENANIKDRIRDIHLQYAMIDSLQGNWEEAYKHSRLYSAYKESLFNETVNEQVESLKIQYETEKKDKENVLLKLDNETQFSKNLLLSKQNEITRLNLKAEQDQHLISKNLTKQQKDSILSLETQGQIQAELSKKERDLRIAEANLHQKVIKEKNLFLWAVFLVSCLTGVIIYLASRAKKRRFQAVLKEVEEKALRAQLKPHFVFNALASIQNYVRTKPHMAEEYLTKFSHFTQEVLVNSEKKQISLADELSLLEKYIELHNLRLTTPIQYSFNLGAEIDPEEIMIPPAILQPLIENSINHNFSITEGEGKLQISFSLEDGLLKCLVEDSCDGLKKTLSIDSSRNPDRKSFGTQIVRDRIELWSKGKSRKPFLEFKPKSNGMDVILGIPQ